MGIVLICVSKVFIKKFYNFIKINVFLNKWFDMKIL